MERLNGYRMRVMLIGIVTAVVLGSGNAKADFTFGEPTSLEAPVNTPDWNLLPHISSDELTLYFSSSRPGSLGASDIWVTTRPTKEDCWAEPENLGAPVNTPDYEWSPYITTDGLELYFHSNRPGGYGWMDLWVVRRETSEQVPEGYWGTPRNLGPTVNSAYLDGQPYITHDGLEFFFTSDRPSGLGDGDLWVMKRLTVEDPWGEPVNLGPTINSASRDRMGSISSDGLILFFDSERPGGYGESDIWMSKRPTVSDDWGPPVNLGSTVNTTYGEGKQSISADGLTLYFSGKRPGGLGSLDTPNLWQASIIPIVDFNGDGDVDARDILALSDDWGTDDSLFDIGPVPWGDGVVDIEDLKVLADYIGQDVYDPTLIAHWVFDEIEGTTAQDMSGSCDGTVVGTPFWHPDAGRVDGALELDGSTLVVTDHVLNPSDGPFSVLAWVKSNTPGQVIVSQASGENWLCTDPMNGCLMTELRGAGRISNTLCSGATISDGSWHRVAVVYDGDDRSLYVDDILVAADTQAGGPADCLGGLNIGCGRDMAPDSFFTGLIDDVRIYNRAVRP
jgi:Concanavalin A-like lectin/glucanases superfamily/WD40-like Beta Propeller Repeat